MARSRTKLLTIAVDIRYPDARGRVDYHRVGALVFNPALRLAGFHYDARYDGPPLDPAALDHRQGTRTFLFRTDRPLPAALNRLLLGLPQRAAIHCVNPSMPRPDEPNRWLQLIAGYEMGGLRAIATHASMNADHRVMIFTEPVRLRGRLTLRHDHPLALSRFHTTENFQVLGRNPADPGGIVLEDDRKQRWFAVFDSLAGTTAGTTRLQAVVHETLRSAGFHVPAHRFTRANNGEPVSLTPIANWVDGGHQFALTIRELENGRPTSFRQLADRLAECSADPDADRVLLAERLIASLAFNACHNDHAGTLLASADGYRLAPLSRITPLATPGDFAIDPPVVGNLEEPASWLKLTNKCRLPGDVVSDAISRLFRGLKLLPLHAAFCRLSDDEWATLRQALSFRLPRLAAKLPQTLDTSAPRHNIHGAPSP